MSVGNFLPCERFTLSQEGGWTDRADDPGGATNQGVTLATFRAFLANPDATPDDLRAMTDVQRDVIYQTRYWTPVDGELLPLGIDLIAFDFAVTSGPRTAVRQLQDTFEAADDGVVGPQTLAAIARTYATDPADAIKQFSMARALYYSSLNRPDFIEGWLNRTHDCQVAALAMAVG